MVFLREARVSMYIYCASERGVTGFKMNLQEFELQYRERVRLILDRLQAINLVAVQLEFDTTEIGESIQALNQDFESFLEERQAGPDADNPSGA